MYILNTTKSIANQYLAELRDEQIQKDRMRFRKNLERLGQILAYELSKSFDFQSQDVKTPLGVSSIDVMKSQLLLVPILRAALPFYQGVLSVFDEADSGFIGAYRFTDDEKQKFDIHMDYIAAPALTGKRVILIDPMLASGKSIVKTLDSLLKYGKPSHLDIMSIIAAPEGVAYLEENIKVDFSLWLGAIDDKLNDKSYIVPGLGDAGDLAFGEKL